MRASRPAARGFSAKRQRNLTTGRSPRIGWFARRFGLRLEMVRGWEDRSLTPDPAAVTLLRVIWAEPETVRRVVAAE